MLGLEAEAAAVAVFLAALADRSIEEIAAIELDAWLGGVYAQHAAGVRIADFLLCCFPINAAARDGV